MLTASRVSVLGALVVSTLVVREIKDRLHPDALIKVLLHLDGKEERIISVVALLLPAVKVVVKVVGALLLTEKRLLKRSQSHVSCS